VARQAQIRRGSRPTPRRHPEHVARLDLGGPDAPRIDLGVLACPRSGGRAPPRTGETLDVRNRQAVEQPTSFVEFLTVLLQDASVERLSAWHLATASPPVRDDMTSLR
jgi:hypothetical protein